MRNGGSGGRRQSELRVREKRDMQKVPKDDDDERVHSKEGWVNFWKYTPHSRFNVIRSQ